MSTDHQLLLKKLEPGDIILTSKRFAGLDDIKASAIRAANRYRFGFDKRYWVHVAIYMGGDQIIEAMPNDLIVPKKLSSTYLDPDCYALKFVRLRHCSKKDRSQIADACKEEGGEKTYDFFALIYFLLACILKRGHPLLEKENLGNAFNVEDKFFCSELAAHGMQKVDHYPFDKDPHQIMPAEFDNKKHFETVAELHMKKKGLIESIFPEWCKKIAYSLLVFVWGVFVFTVGFFAQHFIRRLKR